MTAQIEHYPKCKDCKFWERQLKPDALNTNDLASYGICRNELFVSINDWDIEDKDGQMNHYAGCAISGEFYPNENFGCIHFTGKE